MIKSVLSEHLKRLALGTASHAIGTAKAIEFGKTEGAMSSLSNVVAEILTVAGASVFCIILLIIRNAAVNFYNY